MKRAWLFLLWVPLLAAQVVPDLYIVQLSGAPAAAVARKGLTSAAAVSRRAEIRREQEAVRADVNRLGAQVVGAVDVVANALIVRAPGLQPADLAALSGVARVYPAHRYRVKLDHALPLHKVPDAWQALGGKDNAGLGMKIGILDTGIDNNHAGFQDSSLPMPDGFPKADNAADQALTSSKIIVARNYTDEPDTSDLFGHGTATAMVAAGVTNTGPNGTITGVAPKAYIGNYKVLGADGSGSDTGIIQAMNDAIVDGMDVLNFSFGDSAPSRPQDDPLDQAIETAASMGVVVAVSAGNEGNNPETISSPATAASAIAVGASKNDRAFASGVILDSVPPYAALPAADAPMMSNSIGGPLVDVTQFDATGLACDPLPAGSLNGDVVLILRGTCNFSVKLNNAQQAGAIAAVIYTHSQQPQLSDVGGWLEGNAGLPAEMVSNADGLDIKSRLAANPGLNVTLQFQPGPVSVDPNGQPSWSSRGPNSDQNIKPDLLAVGTNMSTATQSGNPDASTMYDPSGYTVIDGTSFSSPLVAGAAALVKQAHPGLNVQQYRSLLINSASTLTVTGASQPTALEWEGAGVLNLANAFQQTVAAFPTSLSFGWGGGTADVFRDLTLTNVSQAADSFTISVVPVGNGPSPNLSANAVQLGPGETQKVTLEFSANSLDSGEYQGFLQIQGTQSQMIARVPYWYGVANGVSQYLTVLLSDDSGSAGSMHDIYFRANDSTGVPVSVDSYTPQVTPLSDPRAVLGRVMEVISADADVPDAYLARVRLSLTPGINVFTIQVGNLTTMVQIAGN